MTRPALLLVCLAAAAAFTSNLAAAARPPAGPDRTAQAERLAREFLIIDTHIDVPYKLQEKMEDISKRTGEGDFDFPRAAAGGLDAAFMSIFVPASYQTAGGAGKFADGLIDMVEKIAADHPDKFAIARSPREVRDIAARGAIALPLGMENGAPVEEDLANLRHFFYRGIRYITLTHSENNQICDSSYAKQPTWNGLSPFGRKVVAEMNRLGIMVDVSHVTDKTFQQVIEISEAPVIASHSSCRKFTPGWERNMDDGMIQRLASKGGVIQINFGSAFLREDAQKQSDAYHAELDRFKASSDPKPDDQQAKQFEERYWKEHAKIYADISDVADHIDHVVSIAGVDHVGFGSDFDGVGDSLPVGLKDVSQYPNLIRELLQRGYSEGDIRKICGENLLRVWTEVEKVARRVQKRARR